MIFLSPGVKTQEVDYSTYVGQTSSCIAGMVGGASKGVIGKPVLCTSPSNFVETFGEPLATDYGALAALEFLKRGNQLYYVRAAENTVKEAKVTLSTGVLTVIAKEKGTFFHRFSVEIKAPNAEGLFKLVLYKNGLEEETFTASFNTQSEYFVENLKSHWVDFVFEDSVGALLPAIASFSGQTLTRDAQNKWHIKKETTADTLTGLTFSSNVTVGLNQLLWFQDTQTGEGYTAAVKDATAGVTTLVGTDFTVVFTTPLDFSKGPWVKEFSVKLQSANGLTTEEHIVIESVAVGQPTTITGTGTGPTVIVTDTPTVVPTSEPQSLVGGVDGLPLTSATVIGKTPTEGLQAFGNAEELDINVFAAPGHSEEAVVSQLVAIAEARADAIAIIDPPQGLSVQDVIAWHNGTLLGENYPKKAINSSYAAIFYPWVKVTDIYSGKEIWTPPSGVVMGAFAYNDNVGQPWFAPAGLNRGMLNSVVEVERALGEGERDALYGNGSRINAIINYKKQGITIWGQCTTQRKTSATDRINVRRLMNMVRKAVSISTAYIIFEQNDALTWRKWVGMVEPYLESIKQSRGLYDYKVVMDETTVTSYYADRNEMPGQIWLKPTKTAEFIPIDFILTSSGATFTD